MHFILKQLTEITEMNCGSMMELMLQVWLLISILEVTSYPNDFIVFNNELYFEANDGTNGNELWKYDGVNAPSMIADIYPGSGSSGPSHFMVV